MSRGSEYQLWIEHDPHARSWQTIRGDEGVKMMQRLGILDDDRIVDAAGFDNCLACHNSTRCYNDTATRRNGNALRTRSRHTQDECITEFLREGVGCTACHGPSERWIGNHYQYGWSPFSATQDGFVAASDLYVRARMCASCHVGDKDRDMNHDIIAAGHPPLRFELASYHARQPKHWRDAEAHDKTFHEAQLWLAGQIAATDASLSLLETRASRAHSVSQWPEFAAHECDSCHHNLTFNSGRRPFGGGRRGFAIYSPWNDAGLRWLIRYRVETDGDTPHDRELLRALNSVKQLIREKAIPCADDVAKAAATARVALANWFDSAAGMHERQNFRSGRLGRLAASAAGKRATFQTWESAQQIYLAVVAARESWPGGWHGPLRSHAAGLRYGVGNRPSKLNRSAARQAGIKLTKQVGPVLIEEFDEKDELTSIEARFLELEQRIDKINQSLKRE